jgi:hypothetical protein
MAKWSQDLDVVCVFHDLWEKEESNAAKIQLRDDTRFELFDVLSSERKGDCKWGGDMKRDGLLRGARSRDARPVLRVRRCDRGVEMIAASRRAGAA